MADSGPRVAGAPVSWGIIEIPDWGYQMPADRVLREAASLGLTALEAGPEGFLPQDPSEVSELLAGYGLEPRRRLRARRAARPGPAREGAGPRRESGPGSSPPPGPTWWSWPRCRPPTTTGSSSRLDEGSWRALFESLKMVEEICGRHGITVSLHPHYGTVIERDDQLKRFLEGSEMGLCLDTGHLAIGGSDPVEIAEHGRRPGEPRPPERRGPRAGR